MEKSHVSVLFSLVVAKGHRGGLSKYLRGWGNSLMLKKRVLLSFNQSNWLYEYETSRGRRRDTDRDVGVAVDAVVEDDLVDLLVALLHVASVAQTPNV